MTFICFLFVTLLLLLVICDFVAATDNEEDDDEDDGIYCAYTKSMRFCKQVKYAQIVPRKVVALELTTSERTSVQVSHGWVSPLERRIIALEKGLEANQKILNKLDEQLDRIQAQLQVLRDDIDDNRDMVCSISRRLEEFSQRLGMPSKKPLNWLHNNTSAKSVWTAIERDILVYVLRDCNMTLPDIKIGSFRELLVLLTYSSSSDNTAVASMDSIKATDAWFHQSDDYKAGVLARLEHVRATEGMQEVEQMLEDWKEHCDERSYEGLRMFLQRLEKRSKKIKAATENVAEIKD